MRIQKFSLVAILCLSLAFVLSACGGKSDADIQKEVQSRVNKPGVTVAVKDGVVTLTGTVATQDEAKAAEASAKGEGVKSVTNNLQWRGAATPTTPTTTVPAPVSNTNSAANANAKPK